MRVEMVGSATLYLADCMTVLPTLGADVASTDAGVYTENYEKSAIWKPEAPAGSGGNLGETAAGDRAAVCERRLVARETCDVFQRVATGNGQSNPPAGASSKVEGEGGRAKWEIPTWQGRSALSDDDRKRSMQFLRSDGETLHPSQGRRSLQQHAEQSRGLVHELSFLDAQNRVVALPTEWAILTDPPYGIAYSPGRGGKGWTKGVKTFSGSDLVHGDKYPFDPSVLLSFGLPTILWGANHYADKLPAKDSWLIWDKREGSCTNDFADCEMAWFSEGGPARLLRHLWNGAFRKSERGITRVHPTQKPIAVMQWCLGFLPNASTVLDPFMGSGTTGVACAKLGRSFIGIEIDETYFNIAVERIRKAYTQPDFFVEQPKPAEQLDMLRAAE